ncbi:MAG: electron transfer flavoprotein subunit alpha/FixB family protein [Caldimicrobium sp.]
MGNFILAYGEYHNGKLHPASLEILTPLREIADKLKKKLVLFLLIEDAERLKDLKELERALCDEIWYLESQEFKDFKDDLFGKVIAELVKETNPYGVFFPATPQGMALAPRVAGELGVGLCAHVNAFEVEGETLYMLRPSYGENIIAKLYSTTLPVMATVSLHAFPIREGNKKPEIKEITLKESVKFESKLKIRKVKPIKREPSRLTVAKVVLAGGLGLKRRENFEKLKILAEILEAEVGVTRPLYYAGWAEEDRMIGVSGVTVRPKLYIGFGISGAIQHTMGMENSEFIIAINIDKEAPLVKMAHLSLIVDAEKFLDALLRQLKEGGN